MSKTIVLLATVQTTGVIHARTHDGGLLCGAQTSLPNHYRKGRGSLEDIDCPNCRRLAKELLK